MYTILPAITHEKGPQGESSAEIRKIILSIMEHYNMHHVPSPEMDELDLSCFFLAINQEKHYVGASGYKMLEDGNGKTTLLSVIPEHAKHGIGGLLQKARIEKMRSLGAKHVTTNADRPETIAWYKKQGYREIGTLPKIHSFGLDSVSHWTTLRLDL